MGALAAFWASLIAFYPAINSVISLKYAPLFPLNTHFFALSLSHTHTHTQMPVLEHRKIKQLQSKIAIHTLLRHAES